MIRSMCAVLFSLVLATVIVTSPQSTEAKDRRCRPQCCPQPVCSQPQPACCPSTPTCCQPQAKSYQIIRPYSFDPPYFCAYPPPMFDMGSVCYYYAPHCDPTSGLMPICIAGTCTPQPAPMGGECSNAASSAFCVGDGLKFITGTTRAKGPNAGVSRNARLERKLPEAHGGPGAVHNHFRVEKVGNRMYFIKFDAKLPGVVDPVYAKVAQYDVSYRESEQPHHTPTRIAIGAEVNGQHPNALPGNAVAVPGNDHAFNVEVDHGNGRIVTYSVMVAHDRNN